MNDLHVITWNLPRIRQTSKKLLFMWEFSGIHDHGPLRRVLCEYLTTSALCERYARKYITSDLRAESGFLDGKDIVSS